MYINPQIYQHNTTDCVLQMIPMDVMSNSNMDPYEYYVAVYTGWNAAGGQFHFPFLIKYFSITKTLCIIYFLKFMDTFQFVTF